MIFLYTEDVSLWLVKKKLNGQQLGRFLGQGGRGEEERWGPEETLNKQEGQDEREAMPRGRR